ncbi:phage major capsid protein [Methylocapsa acidiphila]|uniref:phage major capsid protein n=1 Tax=Methylocapsa acidiphila TaxID=133552 RepID=UPI000410E842|nr:phage major capsid protein [Methylocapsa acidiphila]
MPTTQAQQARIDALTARRKEKASRLDYLAGRSTLTAAESKSYDFIDKEIDDINADIAALRAGRTVYAQAQDDPFTSDAAAQQRGLGSSKGLVVGAMVRAAAAAGGSHVALKGHVKSLYGERHPVREAVNKALIAGIGSSGGFLVPPEQATEIVDFLYPKIAVRAAEPLTISMPHGTLTLPIQTSVAAATYQGERGAIAESQPSFGQIIGQYKKLTGMVRLSNDLLRYGDDPGIDAMVRNDLIRVLALKQDYHFIVGDGTQDTPRGFLSFANQWAMLTGGSAGLWSSSANSTAAVGGNFITSAGNYTLSTILAELYGLIAKLEIANVPNDRRAFFMHGRTLVGLAQLYNSIALPMFPDLLRTRKIWGIPVYVSNQIPINIWDAAGMNKDCSFVILAEMTEAIVLDSMELELAASREGSIYDSQGNLHSLFVEDSTAIRAIQAHDFQMRHPAAVAVAQLVRWAPSLQ